jgi:protein ImuA
MAVGNPKITRLLEHPAIWRGRSAAQRAGWPTGFAALDEHLPDKGWPRTGLIELLVARFGGGELRLLMPALAALTRAAAARWCVWVAPPLVPFAPALASCGVELDLGSGACDVVLGWVPHAQPRHIRRLQLAAERGRTLGVLFRPRRAAREASAAVLRLSVEPCPAGVRLTLLKGRSAHRGVLELPWPGS